MVALKFYISIILLHYWKGCSNITSNLLIKSLFMQNNTRFLQKAGAFSFGRLFITASVFGQNLTVTGTVKDVTGEPVIGANVIGEGNVEWFYNGY